MTGLEPKAVDRNVNVSLVCNHGERSLQAALLIKTNSCSVYGTGDIDHQMILAMKGRLQAQLMTDKHQMADAQRMQFI